MLICKWTINSYSPQRTDIGGGKILHVDCQLPGTIQVWTEESTVPAPLSRTVVIVPTGGETPPNCEHIGTAIDGVWVWHLYEEVRF